MLQQSVCTKQTVGVCVQYCENLPFKVSYDFIEDLAECHLRLQHRAKL